jgi:hypothetical protein
LQKYYAKPGITSYQNGVNVVENVTTLSQPLQPVKHYTKVGNVAKDGALAIAEKISLNGIQQTLGFNVTYYSPESSRVGRTT